MNDLTITNSTFESAFNEQERRVIDTCIANGQFGSVVTMLDQFPTFMMTPEKERLLNEHMNASRKPDMSETFSKVREELYQKEMREGYRIDSPEKEAYWQSRLNEEEEEKMRLNTIKDKFFNQPEPAKEEVPETEEQKVEATLKEIEDVDDEVLTRDELKAKLTAMGIEHNPKLSKPELLDLLKANSPA